jgi:hypothetical protein
MNPRSPRGLINIIRSYLAIHIRDENRKERISLALPARRESPLAGIRTPTNSSSQIHRHLTPHATSGFMLDSNVREGMNKFAARVDMAASRRTTRSSEKKKDEEEETMPAWFMAGCFGACMGVLTPKATAYIVRRRASDRS